MSRPDHDLDAERAVLGAILLEPSRFDEASSDIGAADFFRVAHAHVWRAMARLHEAGTGIDYKLVSDALQVDRLLDEVGVVYLVGLVDGVPKSSNVGYYAGIVRDLAERRALVRLLATTSAAVEADGVTPDAVGPLKAALDLPVGGHISSTAAHERAVLEQMGRERARRDAQRRLDAEGRPPLTIPAAQTLIEILREPDADTSRLIDGWQTRDSRVLFVAQYKSGKSTTVANMGRSLVDGDDFLGVARVSPLIGTLAVVDTELSKHLMRRWWGAQGIRNQDRVLLFALKHHGLMNFDITTDATRAAWAHRLKDAGVEYLVLDCLRPMLDALGLDDNREAGLFLAAFDQLLVEAGITNAMVVDHMGHGADRPRGESRKRDWCDAEWRLTRKSDDPASERSIAAYGRDIDQYKQVLAFNPVTRRLSLERPSHLPGEMSRPSRAIFDLLHGSTFPLNSNQIKAKLKSSGIPRAAIESVLNTQRNPSDWLVQRPGLRGAKNYSLSPTFPPSRTLPPPSRERLCAPPSDLPSAYVVGAGIGRVAGSRGSRESF